MKEVPLCAITDEVVGKVFRVEGVGAGMRRCVICTKLFTRGAAAEHAKVTCYPENRNLHQA